MSDKKRLRELDDQIKFWDNLAKEFPQTDYCQTRDKVIRERTDLVNKIGKGKCRNSTKK